MREYDLTTKNPTIHILNLILLGANGLVKTIIAKNIIAAAVNAG
jgi:hypothetical protein